ncbi:MAG: 1-acyl-sn-glycerol-3-phosphate acyltransferase [Rikenellaceae bacterium]|nr:1-acyl-sn-glycerol-3-phosphate acyltransferase [Rikenellaceae bacterium]
MKREKKIQDYSWWYSTLRYYVDLVLKLSYRNVRYVGTENIPQNGAVIYAPNHTNALMDALVILAMDRKPKVFVARADIFKNKTLAKIFHFLKILPIMRMRDGIDEVRKNDETINKAVDVLRDRVPFCIFPEGTHQAKFSSLPLSKGIFRIAFQAQELMPDMPLWIVPVGIRYGSFFRFRSTVRVQIGDPINVRDFMEEHVDYPMQVQINLAKDMLTERMKQSIFYIPDDENYSAMYEICAATAVKQARTVKMACENANLHELDVFFKANNNTVWQVRELRERDPEKVERLLKVAQEAGELRRSKNISLSSVAIKYPFWSRVLKLLFVLVALPYCLPVSILTLPIKALCGFLFTKMKDLAFRNSVRFILNLLLWPVLMIIYAIIAFVVLPWQWALLVIVALVPAPIVAHETWRLIRLGISDVKFMTSRTLRAKYREIRQIMQIR